MVEGVKGVRAEGARSDGGSTEEWREYRGWREYGEVEGVCRGVGSTGESGGEEGVK